MIDATHAGQLNRERDSHIAAGAERFAPAGRTALWVLLSSACYYLSTRIAWELCFPDSKVCLFFPPHAVLVSVLLLVPTRHWWAYTLAAIGAHFVATQQAQWPPLYALHCEVFDAAQNLAVAAGIRAFIKSPFKLLTLRDAIVFVLIAVIIVPFGTAFWGAAFTVSNHFGTDYWTEWRNLGISNAVTAIVLVPAILVGAHYLSAPRIRVAPMRLVEGTALGASILMAGAFAFDRSSAGPGASPALLYAPIPLLMWAALRFGLGGVSAAMLAITFQAVWGTMHGRGPFLTQTPSENALALQILLMVMAIPLVFLAVVAEQEQRSKDALRESEARFRTMADTAPVLIWMSGLDKLCTFFNKGWLAFTGRTMQQELGNGWAEGVHRDDYDRCLEAYSTALDARVPFTMEYRLRRRDGEFRWILDRGAPRFGSDGAFLGFVGCCIDLTERRKAEADLRTSQERMDLAAEAAHLGMWVWDVPANAMWASEKCHELFALPKNGEISYEAFLQRVHPEDRPEAEGATRLAIARKAPYRAEYRLLLPDQTQRWIAASGRVDFDSAGNPIRMLGICIDISEQREAKDAARELSGRLIHAQEDERRRIARDLHDDLNQQLALLSVEMELLGRESHKPESQHSQHLEQVAGQIKELSSDVHKLSHNLHPAKLDQLGLVSAARGFCRELTQQSGIRIEFDHKDVPRDVPAEVALCLYRIIQESLQNMVRHSGAKEAAVRLHGAGDHLKLLIIDSGKGFDLEVARRTGGLGLISMQERARLVHGSIAIRSRPGHGTKVEISVPLPKDERSPGMS